MVGEILEKVQALEKQVIELQKENLSLRERTPNKSDHPSQEGEQEPRDNVDKDLLHTIEARLDAKIEAQTAHVEKHFNARFSDALKMFEGLITA